MPANKSHHYVPKFYLRNFTTPNRPKSITLYNIAKRRLILSAAIDGQCCKDYFYGKNPAAEKGLSGIEGIAASLFRRMRFERRMPRPMTSGHLVLCLHMVLQHYRTKYAADELNEKVNGMVRETFRGDPDVPVEQLDSVRFGFQDPALYTTVMAMELFPIVMDLGIGALVAPPHLEFLTSDNPVVMYNQFMNWRMHGSNTGLGSKGLQVFFPVWPWLTVVLYDKDVYHFGDTKHATHAIASPEDVHELNVLQAVSASENLYMHGPSANAFAAAEHAARFRRKVSSNTVAYDQPERDGRRSTLIATSSEDIRTDAALAFMKTPKRSKRWLDEFKAQRTQPAVVVRNEDLMNKIERHEAAVKAGTARREDVMQYAYGVSIADDTY